MIRMLIVHHWDTDGIASAAKIARLLKAEDHVNLSPRIGDFSFDMRITDEAGKHDEIYILDLNLPGEAKKLDKGLTFIDHHIQEKIEDPRIVQINPLVEGKDPSEFPSCTTVISDHYIDWDLLSALGAIGDIGEKALEHPLVRREIERSPFDISDVSRLVSLIDSNYLSVDLKAVEGAVQKLLSTDMEELLEDKEWNRRLDDIEGSIRSVLNMREDRGEFTIIDFNSPYNIISRLARKAVWELGYAGALVVNRDFHGKGQMYFRINNKTAERMDMASIIATLKEMGINAGGKKEVVGSVYPRERTEEVLSVMRPLIR